MDWLYCIFYTVLSLAIITALISPIVIMLRFLTKEHEKKYMIRVWYLVYLRSICPIALSSPICLFPAWNRRFHLFLEETGLTIKNSDGILNSWIAVFQKDIATTMAFKGCSIIWAFGVVFILLLAVLSQRRLTGRLQSAKSLGGNIYETSAVPVPVRTGWFQPRLYIPEGTSFQEIKWLLKAMEYQRREIWQRIMITLIIAIQWFNPVIWLYYYLWNIDAEMAKDERLIYHKQADVLRNYAQALFNYRKASEIPFSFSTLTLCERHPEKRARRMMYQKWDTSSGALLEALLLSVLAIWLFLLAPIQIAWSGGTRGGNNTPAREETLFDNQQKQMVAKAETVSPEGLKRLLQLEMLSGSESQDGYDGNFQVTMYDSIGNVIAEKKLEELFPDMEKGTFHFTKGLALHVKDYNGDGIQELVLGQQMELSQDKFQEMLQHTDEKVGTKTAETAQKAASYQIVSYTLLNIENEAFRVACSDIYAVTEEKGQKESTQFEVPENSNTIFQVPFVDTELYYIWDEQNGEYQQKYLKQEELAEYLKGNGTEGETREHTLKNTAGDTQVLVSAKKDNTGSEAIQSVILQPGGRSKKWKDIKGYFCDLFWVSAGDEEKERYAVLVYNGTKAQTFMIYDVMKGGLYYQQEDGSENLQELFKQYNEGEITFKEDKAVIYSLKGKNGDILYINFAAEADGGIAIRGSYQYDVGKKIFSNLSYSRFMEDGASPNPTDAVQE